MDSWETFGRRTWTAGECSRSCSSTQVTVEPGEHDQLEGDRGGRQAARFEVAGVQLDMGTADLRQWVQVVLGTPVEPETHLSGVRLAGAWGRVAGDQRDRGPAGQVLLTGDGQDQGGCGHGRTSSPGTGRAGTLSSPLVSTAAMVDAQPVAYTGPMTEQQAGLIATDPDVVGGQACVRGTRIPVSVILDCLAAGLSEAEIMGQYPTLTVEGVRAAAAYGAALAREEIHPLPA